MTLFYFDIHDAGVIFRDDVGQELATPLAAREVAVAILPGLTSSKDPTRDSYDAAVHVRDATGKPVLTARLSLRTEWAA